MSTRPITSKIEADLSRSLVLGLRWEYARAVEKAPEEIRRRVSTRPNIMLSDYVKRRYGKMRSIGRPSRARKSSYHVGKKASENMVLHRGIEAASTASGLMLTDKRFGDA